jgi:hypothetical protein
MKQTKITRFFKSKLGYSKKYSNINKKSNINIENIILQLKLINFTIKTN